MAEAAAVADGESLNLSGAAAAQDPAAAFAEKSHLTYVVPSATGLELEDLFKDAEQGQSIIDSIQRRESLFFDETVDLLLILKVPWLGETAFRSQLPRLVISVEARILNGSSLSGHGTPPTSDTVFTGTVSDVSDPFIIMDEEEAESDSEDEVTRQYVYAVWKVPVFLARPRMRLQSPSVVFTASAGLRPEAEADLASGGSGYLPSSVPSGFNLLESFSNDPALNGIKPRLSALRVSRVAPRTRQPDARQHIRALQQLQLRIHPVVHTRIRFSRPHTTPATSAMVAILEVDFTPYFDCEVTLDEIQLSVPDASIQSLSEDAAMQLPVSCVAHDHLTFLYHVVPHEADVTGTRDLSISIAATAQLIPQACTPKLVMAWTATADFTLPVNPGFGPSPGTSSIQRGHRPSQLSISNPNSGQAITPLKSPSVTQPDALPALVAATTRPDTSLQDLGVTMSLTGPAETVRVGDTFSWAVHVVNRSPEQAGRQPRRFALVAIPRRRRNELRAGRPLSSSSGRRGVAGPPGSSESKDHDVADAVLDENVLHAMQKSSVVGSTDVVCLTADARVGPLAPGACHVANLQFLALKQGLLLGIEAVRVVDLASQEHVDIRDLPAMMVEPAAA
ncbi:hypothetical protein ACRE_011370 [Hapsidospora chrysogenum ATCC 11550]|uniref:Trafficking protein particle complex II-specific subunit 65 IgD3 domain-containing protein n=1 Tax=Hapsidospora chrysogenum (strain ATCC 11550 / CBS 779.69 / DSM 880 / IAM 14645 / JCM 23072 / IMI 49137) TaxID=857340 RepID=A0A086TEY0_HAPC1|nr:hypothetical protein ACRE_011370 [Hapsidospora chrysogenum ATCC 11550]